MPQKLLGVRKKAKKYKFIKLMAEICKTTNHLNPPYMWDLFTKKMVKYDFRIKILCELPPARAQRYKFTKI